MINYLQDGWENPSLSEHFLIGFWNDSQQHQDAFKYQLRLNYCDAVWIF